MKKKLVMIVIVLILLSFAVYVSADVPSATYVQNERGQAKDFISQSPSSDPYIRSTYNIYKGWNLVPVVENGNPPARARNTFAGYGSRILGCNLNENFDSWQIKYQYDNIPGVGYVGGELDYNTGRLKEPAKTQFENSIRDYYLSPQMGGQEGIYSFMFTSRWYYSDMDCSYHLNVLDLNSVEKQMLILNRIKLSKGWNLISIMPAFLGKEFKDILGNCQVLKANQWNPITQNWEYSGLDSQERASNLLKTAIKDEYLFVPLAIKVEENCSLGSLIVAPPPLPVDNPPEQFTPDMCIVNAPFGCDEFSINSQGIRVVLRNGAGDTLTSSNISLAGCDEIIRAIPMQSDKTTDLIFSCANTPGTRFRGDLVLTYRKIDSAIESKSTGAVSGKVI